MNLGKNERQAKIDALRRLMGETGETKPILTITICAGKPEEKENQFGDAPDMVGQLKDEDDDGELY